MKKLSITISCLFVMAGLTFGTNENISFNDHNGAGDLNPAANAATFASGTGTLSLSVLASWAGYSAFGLSFWLQVPTAVASSFNLTGVTYGTSFTDSNNSGPATVLFGTATAGSGVDAGFTLETRDLGSTVSDTSDPANGIAAPGSPVGVGTMNLNFSGLAPGTYQIRTTVLTSRISQMTDTSFNGNHNFTQAIFTLTIVPEPATWSLIGLGGLGALGLTWLRARRS